MEKTRAQFKTFLFHEVRSKSLATVTDIYKEIDNYSRTDEFEKAYTKWRFVDRKKRKGNYGVKHISELFD
jgi:hypothetical protein